MMTSHSFLRHAPEVLRLHQALRALLLTLLWLSISSVRAEMAPWVPEPLKIEQRKFISPAEVKIRFGEEFRPMATVAIRNMGGEWKFSGVETSPVPFPVESDQPAFARPDFDDSAWETIPVPRNWYADERFSYDKLLNSSGAADAEEKNFFQGWYRRSFELNLEECSGKRILIDFDAIGYEGTVFVNGRKIGVAHGEFVPTRFDITDAVQPGRNTLAVRVLTDFRPIGQRGFKVSHTYGAAWSPRHIKGGIWQPVTLRIEPEIRFENIRIATHVSSGKIEIQGEVENHTGVEQTRVITAFITDAAAESANQENTRHTIATLRLKPGTTPFRSVFRVNSPRLWGVRDPNLYFLTLTASDSDSDSVKSIETAAVIRFGFREFTVDGMHFKLNGKPVYLFGENLSSSSFGGNRPEAEDRWQLRNEIIQRMAAGCVILRTAHMPAIRMATEIADELGMMIYDEWSFCFSVGVMDEPRFEAANLDELKRFLLRDFNAPSVVMWSLGNEVRHRTDPAALRQLRKQSALVRSIDFQKRPIVSFSGNANLDNFGREKVDGDVLDLHTYHGIENSAWTRFQEHMNYNYQLAAAIYGDGQNLKMPQIAWEAVGYSWGWLRDPEFRPGNLEQYLEYAKYDFNWGNPHGIGFAAATGLYMVIDPNRGPRYVLDRQCGRLFELFRQEPRWQGFASWCAPIDLPQRTRWNQEIYVLLRTGERGLPPHNLFRGVSTELQLYLSNNSSEPLSGATLFLTLALPDGTERPIGRYPIPKVAATEHYIAQVRLTIPKDVPAPGAGQLRLSCRNAAGEEISRNYANINLEDPAILDAPVATSVKIGVLRPSPKNTALLEILKRWRIPFQIVTAENIPADVKTVILPPGENGRCVEEPLQRFVQAGGVLLVLEQNAGSNVPLMPGAQYAAEPNSLADLVLPEHPVFSGMSQENFDLWSGAPEGDVVKVMISPISENVVAAKPPFLVRQTVGSAIAEAAIGDGVLFASQLNACGNYQTEPAAARYLRNLFSYVGNRPLRNDIRPLPRNEQEYRVGKTEPVSLAAYANRSFEDEVAEDRKGGWFDQGRNDFRVMPTGRVVAAGVPFEIIDAKKNHGRSCLIVRGEKRPEFPGSIRNIRVNRKFKALYFLHTAGWGNNSLCGYYRMRYADGSSVDFPLAGGRNIADWWMPKDLPEAPVGIRRIGSDGHEIGFYVAKWENPHPEKMIDAIDFCAASRNDEGEIDYINLQSPVPALAAVTGEF